MTNLFIAYDLLTPGQNYERIHEAIKKLGVYHQFQQSLFYVHTSMTLEQAYAAVVLVMDSNDKLAVIDTASALLPARNEAEKQTIAAVNSIWFNS